MGEFQKIKIILIIIMLLLAVFIIYGASVLMSRNDLTYDLSIFQDFKKPEIKKTEAQLQQEMANIIKTKDMDRCLQIQDAIYKTACVNNIAQNLAKETGNISYCQKIDGKLMPRKDCEQTVVLKKSIDREDINICQETTNETVQQACKSNFWFLMANKKNDISWCQQADSEFNKIACHDAFLFNNQFMVDKSSFNCDTFQDLKIKSDCKIFQKYSANDSRKMCLLLQTDRFKNFCN